MNIVIKTSLLLLALSLTGWAAHPKNPMQAVADVDIERFMGDWYVIAGIPTFPERNAVNPLESYQLNDDGTVATTFSFNKKTADGPKKALKMRAFVNEAPNNGIWAMQWIWPIRADYRIVHLDKGYQFTIIGRAKRDYLWVMSRKPNIAPGKLEELINIAVRLGYPRDKIQTTSWQSSEKEAA